MRNQEARTSQCSSRLHAAPRLATIEPDALPMSEELPAERAQVEVPLVPRDDLIIHELDGEVLIFDPVSCDTHRLNETAHWILSACDGSAKAPDIARAITDVYDVDYATAFDQVHTLLASLRGLGILEPVAMGPVAAGPVASGGGVIASFT